MAAADEWYRCVMRACLLYALLFSIACAAGGPAPPTTPTAGSTGSSASISPPPGTSPASVPRVCQGDVAVDMCDAGEICVEHQGGAPRPHEGACIKLPDACHGTPACGCLERSVCGPHDRCSMDGPRYVSCTCIDCP